MSDCLRAIPSMTIEDYMWKYTIPQIKLMLYDYTHVEYHSEKDEPQKEEHKTIDGFVNDLGIPIFKK